MGGGDTWRRSDPLQSSREEMRFTQRDRNANGRKVEGEKKSYQERVQEVDGHF